MFSLKLTKGLRESRVFVYVQCFPPKVFMIQLLSMIPRQCFISMTIQEVSSWHPGHTKSIQIQTFPNLWGIFCYSLWQQDILKKKLPLRCLWSFFFFLLPLSLSLSFSLSLVLEYISTRPMHIIFLQQFQATCILTLFGKPTVSSRLEISLRLSGSPKRSESSRSLQRSESSRSLRHSDSLVGPGFFGGREG